MPSTVASHLPSLVMGHETNNLRLKNSHRMKFPYIATMANHFRKKHLPKLLKTDYLQDSFH